MKKVLTTFGVIALAFNLSFSQAVNIDVAREQLLRSSDVSIPIPADGSPYINENFLPVKVKGYDDQLFTGRYNASLGEMEINMGSKIIALSKTQPYEVLFTQNNKLYRTYRYTTESGNTKDGFLAIVEANERFELLKEETIKYYERVQAATTYQTDKPARYQKEDDVYFLKRDKVVTFLPTRKKDFINAFPGKSKNIKTFMKENKLNPKKESDMVKLLNHIVTL